jgi:hypothetical protein
MAYRAPRSRLFVQKDRYILKTEALGFNAQFPSIPSRPNGKAKLPTPFRLGMSSNLRELWLKLVTVIPLINHWDQAITQSKRLLRCDYHGKHHTFTSN